MPTPVPALCMYVVLGQRDCHAFCMLHGLVQPSCTTPPLPVRLYALPSAAFWQHATRSQLRPPLAHGWPQNDTAGEQQWCCLQYNDFGPCQSPPRVVDINAPCYLHAAAARGHHEVGNSTIRSSQLALAPAQGGRAIAPIVPQAAPLWLIPLEPLVALHAPNKANEPAKQSAAIQTATLQAPPLVCNKQNKVVGTRSRLQCSTHVDASTSMLQ